MAWNSTRNANLMQRLGSGVGIVTFSLASVLGLGSSGCMFNGFGGGGGGGEDGQDDGSDSAPAAEQLADCRGDASDPELEDTVAIVDDYDESLHEMVVCGGLAVSLCAAIVDGIIDAIIAQSNDATPGGWTYQGEGVYFTGGANTDMEMRFYLASDFEFGRRGDLVPHNLFLVDSYLVNARATVDVLAGSAEIAFDAPGPMVELLGFGADPPNPLSVNLDDLGGIKSRLRALDLEGTVAVDDARDRSTIRYDLDIPRMSAGALLEGVGMQYELRMASGSRGDLDQQLVVDAWNVEFVQGNRGALTGNIDYHVDGRHFPFEGVMLYDNDTFATRLYNCPE
jgi:hypothetical protein